MTTCIASIVIHTFIGVDFSFFKTKKNILFINSELVASDHGEYICRLHDFDRNLLAESAVPILYYGKSVQATDIENPLI